MRFTAEQLAELLNGTVDGDEHTAVTTLASIEEGSPDALSFLYSIEYEEYLYTTRSGIVIVNKNLKPEREMIHNPTLIRVEDARLAFAKVLEAYKEFKVQQKTGIHETAFIEKSAQIGENVYIGPHVYVGEDTKIGDNAVIYSHTFIGDNVKVGENTLIYGGVRINEDCQIGADCIVQFGAVIGSDGFGFQPDSKNDYQKITHIGNVIIGDRVEIGANTTIDRATFGSTVIGQGVKLDNLIQVGHNCVIGENTVIAAQTGLAGSVKIGRDCMIGGQVGFAGHQKIGNKVRIAAQSGISGDLDDNAVVQGSPAVNLRNFQKSYVVFRQLPEMKEELNKLKRDTEKN